MWFDQKTNEMMMVINAMCMLQYCNNILKLIYWLQAPKSNHIKIVFQQVLRYQQILHRWLKVWLH